MLKEMRHVVWRKQEWDGIGHRVGGPGRQSKCHPDSGLCCGRSSWNQWLTLEKLREPLSVHIEASANAVITVAVRTAGCRGPVLLLLRMGTSLWIVWSRIVTPNRQGARDVQGPQVNVLQSDRSCNDIGTTNPTKTNHQDASSQKCDGRTWQPIGPDRKTTQQ